MNLKKLLFHLRNNVLHDRSDQPIGSVTSDYLWSDETLIDFMSEAQRRFAVGSLCIRDGTTPEVTQLTMVPYQKEYQLHQSVIAVISVRCQGDRADLARAGHSQFDTYNTPDRYFFNPATLSEIPPGKVVAFDTDEYVTANDWGSMQVVNLRLYPPPKQPWVQNVKLRVVRKPLQEFTLKNLEAVPEIPDDHHLDFLSWAAYLALRIVDRDAGDPARAQEFKTQFELDVKRARDLVMRKVFAPAQWGFGRNGFSWEPDYY